jgi:hypothetical protein
MRTLRWLTLPALFVVVACVPKPAKRPPDDTPFVEDEWAKTSTVPEWLHVTRGAAGSKEAECKVVLEAVKGEAACSGALCAHGRDLAASFLERCVSRLPGAKDEVVAIRDRLAEAAAQKPDACAAEAEVLFRDECGDGTTSCQETAQKWATRCAKATGSPVVVLLLQRLVERKAKDGSASPIDARSCDELRDDMAKGVTCAQRFACEDVVSRVFTYRSWCEDAGKPTVATAAIELSIIAGAGQSSGPIAALASPERLAPTELPLVLADGLGAVYQVCEQRAVGLPSYLEGRRACEGGKLVASRIYRTGNDVEVRLGVLDYPGDAQFQRRYPSLVVAGELAARDAELLPAFEAELARLVTLGDAGEAAKALSRLVVSHAAPLRRSAPLREALVARDAALVPALGALARAKVAAGAPKRGLELVGFAARAKTWPFAEVSGEGPAAPGQWSRDAAALELGSRMLLSMAAYVDALAPLAKAASNVRPDAGAAGDALTRGSEAASACGAAEKRFREAERALVDCAFAATPCDADRTDSLAKQAEQAQQEAEEAHGNLTLQHSKLSATGQDKLAAAALAAGCVEPVW